MSDEPLDSDSNDDYNPFIDKDDDKDYNPLKDKKPIEDYLDDVEPSSSESGGKGENIGELPSSEQGKELEPDQANPKENTEMSSDEFNPNESESGETQKEFDPNDSGEEPEPEFDPNDSGEEPEPEQFDPNQEGEKYESDFDPNGLEGDEEQQEFDPNESDQYNPDESEQTYDPYENGDNFGQENYSGGYAQTMNTILINENEMVAYIQGYLQSILEKEKEGVEQEKEIEEDNSIEGPSDLEKFLEGERERIRQEQEQAELEQTIENELETGVVANENELEQGQEKEAESQADSFEEISPINQEELDVEEVIEPELEQLTNEEELENQELKLEENEQEKEAEGDNYKEGESELAKFLEREQNRLEQQQTELDQRIENQSKMEVVTNDEELEQEQEKEVEPQVDSSEEIAPNTEEKVNHQVTTEDTNEPELEQTKINEHEVNQESHFKEHQQELDEILEQVSEVEQKALNKVEQEQEREQLDKSIEIIERNNKETKEYEEAFEQRFEARQETKEENPKEQEVEQEKEEDWLNYLVNWVKQESGEEISLQMKENIIEISENYNELDELTTKFLELYQKEQNEQLSPSEKLELKALIKTLYEKDPENIVTFTNLRAMRRSLTQQKLEKQQLNQLLKYMFTQFVPRKQLNRILKANKKQLNLEAELFQKFMQYTHKNELIKNLVNEFNKNNRWMVNLRHTQTFINFVRKKINQLKNKAQAEILVKYLSLIIELKENNSISETIKNLFMNNKGKFNAYDIQNWFLISDVAALNQLKKMFTKEEYQTYVRTQKHVSIKTVQEIAKKKGGKCHTKEIKNAKSKVALECDEGHKFSTTYNSVVYSKTWCPHCYIYYSEEICRQFFERIFKRPFPKSHPPWLNGRELDGDCEELQIAFEKQGEQHRRKAFRLSDEDVRKIQEGDADKLQKCTEHGKLLLQIPDTEIVPWDDMQNYIIKLYEKKSGKSLGNVPKYDWREFTLHENEHAKKFRKYVEDKDGTLISSYFTAKKQVTILCRHGHEWSTTPDSVYRGNWCSECSGNKKGTTEEYRKIGERFQCELINEYVNAKTPLRYKCPKGHTFTRRPYWLKRTQKEIKNICPECEREIYAQKFNTFVKNKGGTLLTLYKGRFKPILIKCKKEHNWETTPGAVYQGSWCKTCANNKNMPNKKRQEAAEQEFLEKINSYSYTLLSKYENSNKQVKIKCQKNHLFTISPNYFKKLVNQKKEPCGKCRKNEV